MGAQVTGQTIVLHSGGLLSTLSDRYTHVTRAPCCAHLLSSDPELYRNSTGAMLRWRGRASGAKAGDLAYGGLMRTSLGLDPRRKAQIPPAPRPCAQGLEL